MNMRILPRNAIWSYLGYLLKVCSNIILLPLILKTLPPDELGIWYVFLSIGMFIQLLDFGFNPTIMRNISYAFGGATQLKKEGIAHQESIKEQPNWELIYKLVNVSKKIYFYISLVAIILLVTAGTYYINYITKHFPNSNILIAWFIYITGVFCNFYYSYWIPLLNGIGKIAEAQYATIISQIAYLCITSIGIILSFGLVAIAVGFLICGIILRRVSKYYFEKNIPLYNIKIEQTEYKSLFDIVWFSSRKIGVVSLGAFLILQASTLICSIFFDLKTTASYGLTLQLFGVVTIFARIPLQNCLPVINEARIKNNYIYLKKYLAMTSVIGWLSFGIGAISIIFFGELILYFIGSKTSLLPREMLIFMAIYLFLEFNHSNYATFIITNNEIPFVKAALISGILIVISSLGLICLFNFGLWGILISQAIIQLGYNNWKWPKVVLEQLQMNLIDIITLGYLECRKIRNILFLKKG